MTKQEQYKKLKLQLESLTGKKVQLIKEGVTFDKTMGEKLAASFERKALRVRTFCNDVEKATPQIISAMKGDQLNATKITVKKVIASNILITIDYHGNKPSIQRVEELTHAIQTIGMKIARMRSVTVWVDTNHITISFLQNE